MALSGAGTRGREGLQKTEPGNEIWRHRWLMHLGCERARLERAGRENPVRGNSAGRKNNRVTVTWNPGLSGRACHNRKPAAKTTPAHASCDRSGGRELLFRQLRYPNKIRPRPSRSSGVQRTAVPSAQIPKQKEGSGG
jgi:hypothetical protein